MILRQSFLFLLILSPIAALAQDASSYKKRAPRERLISQVRDSYGGSYDSSVYQYSNFRTSVLDENLMLDFSEINYDNRLVYVLDTVSMKLAGAHHRTYDSKNQLTSELDSGLYMNTWFKNRRLLYHYDASGHLSENIIEGYNTNTMNWEPNHKEVFLTPSANQTISYAGTWDGTTFDTINKTVRTFQNAKLVMELVTEKSNGFWSNYSKDSISYLNGKEIWWTRFSGQNNLWLATFQSQS
jgi:hypothetical protein